MGYLTKESDAVLHQVTWPPQSPDLDPIEMVWDELDCRVKEKQPTSAQHMWELLQDYTIPNVLFHSFDIFTITLQCRYSKKNENP